jgi:hypothetical protein
LDAVAETLGSLAEQESSLFRTALVLGVPCRVEETDCTGEPMREVALSLLPSLVGRELLCLVERMVRRLVERDPIAHDVQEEARELLILDANSTG